MDFFARQERSRRTTRVLVGAFLLAFLVVALATTVVVAAGLRLYSQDNTLFLGTESWRDWLINHGGSVALVTLGTFGAMILASLYRAATLARGGGQVARMMGGTPINSDSTDPLQRRLVNVVEEMALASGLPVPEIYVLEHEAGINAFAAGLSPADAAIAVTRGALERLERAELQGVIAHEFSHIVNGDMRLNQQLIGLSFGILVLSLAGRWLLRSARFARPRRGRGGGGVAAAMAIGLALTIIGGIGVLLSRFIKAGVSRERERLADASAVQFTREPEGLAGALKKIGGYSARIVAVDTEEVAHMLFGSGSSSFGSWLATHPPLIERIRALEPNFDPRDLPTASAPLPDAATDDETRGLAAPLAAAAAAVGSPLAHAGEIGTPEGGRALRNALPDEVYHATRSREASLLIVAALAVASDAATRQQQLALLQRQLGAGRASLCERLVRELDNVESRLRLPILELSLPALKQRPVEQLIYLRELVIRLQALDATPRLFDFVLLRVLEAYFRHLPGAALPRADGAGRLDPRAATRALLGNVAAFGHEQSSAARAAYAAGLAALGWRAEPNDPTFEPPTAARKLDELDAALTSLATVRPRDKERVLRSVLATIQHDATMTEEELELFRLIAASLDCPLPPNIAL